MIIATGIIGMGAATTSFTSFFSYVGFGGGFLLAVWTGLVSYRMSRAELPEGNDVAAP